MIYNLFKLNNSVIVPISNSLLPISINDRLKIIEENIIENYLLEQKNMVGIKGLGNKIRYSTIIKNQLDKIDNGNNILIKMTENRRAFKHILIDSIYKFNNSNIFFLVLEKEFGKESKLVDNSFININEIIEEVSNFFQFFEPKINLPAIHFIEFSGFDKYRIQMIDGYSKIHYDADK